MKRVLLALLATVVSLSGLVLPTAAEATSAAPAASSCQYAYPRHEWQAPFVLEPGDCYQTDGGYLVMQHDGNLVIYDLSWQPICHSITHGWPGARAIFQPDGNFVIYYYNYAIAWSGTQGNPGSKLIFNVNARLRIRNAAGALIWDMCRDGFHRPW